MTEQGPGELDGSILVVEAVCEEGPATRSSSWGWPLSSRGRRPPCEVSRNATSSGGDRPS